MTPTHCTAPGCTKPHRARGLCVTCYNRQVRAGTLQTGTKRTAMPGQTCSFDGCERPIKGLGLCGAHYNQRWREEELRPLSRQRPQRTCDFDGCDNKHNSHGYCSHHARMLRDGKELTPIKEMPPRLPRKPGHGCSVAGCDGSHKARGMCVKHLRAFYRTEAADTRPKVPARPPKAPKQAKAATPKPAKSTLPPTWERVQPVKRHLKPAGGDAEIGPVRPTDPAIMRTLAAKLRRWGDVDLIDMLGVTPDRIADAEAEWGRVA